MTLKSLGVDSETTRLKEMIINQGITDIFNQGITESL